MITETARNIDLVIGVLFFALYFYQIVFFIIPFVKKEKPHKEAVMHRYAILISARDEENVIAALVRSICGQDYPEELVDIYVIADNCSDSTAKRAEEAGATVFIRNDLERVGKGYALDYAVNRIFRERGDKYYDGFMVFDADNILDSGYINAINRVFSDGYRVITSYRNSTNYGANWITAGYALWYIRESRFMNYPRMLLGHGCAVSGTGFLVHKDVIKRYGGWKFFLLTEDIEFSVVNAIDGERIAFCGDAVLYDEQPQTFRQSWTQRLRWARGFLQVFGKYGSKIFKGIFGKNKRTCFDMAMTIMPAVFVTFALFIFNAVAMIVGALNGENWRLVLLSLGQWLAGVYFMLFAMGLITTIYEWKRIHTSTLKKILYLFTFPIFQFTYIPVSIAAMFKKVEWKPTRHSGTADVTGQSECEEYTVR